MRENYTEGFGNIRASSCLEIAKKYLARRSAKLQEDVPGKREISQALVLPQECLHPTGVSKKQLGVTPIYERQGRPGKGEEIKKGREGASK